MKKEKALEIALSRIEKGSIVRLGRVRLGGNVDVIPTGALPLDVALGVGGIPRGRTGCVGRSGVVSLRQLRLRPNTPLSPGGRGQG